MPDRAGTRLLAGVADQIGQALARDRVAEEARSAEVARQSDALKSSLLQSVSHDFRTPLAVIQAAAGSLDSDASPEDRHADRVAIEREVQYLNRLVANLLDLSRIEAGALRADRDVYELDDLVGQAVARVRPRLAGRTLDVRIDPLLVTADPVFLDAAITNVLENAVKYTQDTGAIAIAAQPIGPGRVRVTIDDDGPGVPSDALERIFDKFYRVPGAAGGSRGGLGIGLAVVRGLVRAMGGEVTARRGSRGGLAIDIDLPAPAQPGDAAPGGDGEP
jgi:two-component system sensor histidine kinase KdpD